MSILVALIAPLPLLFLLEWAFLFQSGKQWRTAILLHAAIFAILAYYYIPKGDSDLVRYFAWIDECKQWSLLETFEKLDNGLYFIDTLYWIAGNLGVPHIVPMITTCSIYAIAMYISCDYAERVSAERSLWKIILFQICMFHLLYIANNIRNIYAFSIAMLAVYRDYVQEKKNISTWLLYIIPLFIHKTAAIFLFIKVCVLIAKRSRALMLAIAMGIPMLISILYNNMSTLFSRGAVGYYLNSLIDRSYGYLYGNDRQWTETVAKSGYQQVSRVLWILFTIVVVIHLYIYLRNKKDNYAGFVFLLALITLIFTVSILDDAYWRFSTIIVLAYSPILLTSINQMRNNGTLVNVLIISIIPIALARIVMHVYYDRYLLDFAEYFSQIFLSDVLRIVGDVLYNAVRLLW